MTRDLANPLQALIAGAAKALPTATGETDRFKARLSSAGQGVVILADTSSSMAESAGGRLKSQILLEALDQVWPDLPGAHLISFDSVTRDVDAPAYLPSPSGGTALHLGLAAAVAHRPAKTLVITDGRPDSEDEALAAADRLCGIIDVIYCGPDGDLTAIAFLRRLARSGGGQCYVRDVVRMARPQLGPVVRTVLGLPGPKE
jgi:hypothetical protein